MAKTNQSNEQELIVFTNGAKILLYETNAGKWKFRFYAPNKQPLFDSQLYAGVEGAKNGVSSILNAMANFGPVDANKLELPLKKQHKDTWTDVSHENVRFYRLANGENLRIEKPIRFRVTTSGEHQVTTEDKRLYSVHPTEGWYIVSTHNGCSPFFE